MSHIIMLSPMVADASCWSQQPLEYHLHQCAPDGISAHQRAPVRAPESTPQRTGERKRAHHRAHTRKLRRNTSSCRRTKKHFKKTVCFRFVIGKTIRNDSHHAKDTTDILILRRFI